MKYKYMTAKNSPFMAELRKTRKRLGAEMEADPAAFFEKIHQEAAEFFESHNVKDWQKLYREFPE